MDGERNRRGWAVALLFLISGFVLAGRLTPAARWFFRQKSEQVVEEAARRGMKFPTFKLTRRRALIHRLTHDAEILRAAREQTLESGDSMAVTMVRVERYAREIVPSFNAFLYFKIGIPLAGRISRALYDIRIVSTDGLSAVNEVSTESSKESASVVFVMNHRSNMDYVLLAYLTADRTALSYAAGEWACVWPLGRLIGGMGAFFVRRGSGDPLYRRVLERFVQMAVEGGLTQVFFPEGGLSRDGKPREPRIGLLDYMLRRFDPDASDILFVPVGVNYDWVLEDHALLQPGGPEAGLRGRGGLFASTIASVVRNLLTARRAGNFRLGEAALSFGEPLSTREYLDAQNLDLRYLSREARFERVKDLAAQLMRNIGETVPNAAVPIVAHALLQSHRRPVSERELLELANSLASNGARGGEISDPRPALGILVSRRLVFAEQDGYRIAPGAEELLAFYANSISR